MKKFAFLILAVFCLISVHAVLADDDLFDIMSFHEKMGKIDDKIQNYSAQTQNVKIFNKNNLFGASLKGKTVLTAQYNSIGKDNYCLVVKSNNKVGCFLADGKNIVPVKYDKISFLKDDDKLIVTHLNGKQGLYNYEGKLIFEPLYKEIKYYYSPFLSYGTVIAKDFNNKYALFIYDGKLKKIIENVEYISPMEYMESNIHALAKANFPKTGTSSIATVVKNGNKWGLLAFDDNIGEVLRRPEYIYDNITYSCYEYFFGVKNGKTSILYMGNANFVNGVEYDEVIPVPNYILPGRFKAKSAGKYTFIDLRNGLTSKPVFEDIKGEDSTSIKVKQNGKWRSFDYDNETTRINL